MKVGKIYEKYHADRRMQKRVINKDNFTYKTIISFIDQYFKGGEVLDIGSGVGTIDFYLASSGNRVVGLDLSTNAIKLAKKNAHSLNLVPRPKFLVSDFLDYKTNKKFDFVLISEVLEHLINDDLAVKKIYRLLKKKGIVIASCPSKNAPLYKPGWLEKFDNEVGHLRRYTPDRFKSLFTSAGFRIVKVTKTEGIIRSFLFTNPIAGKLIRFLKWPISEFVLFVDNLTVTLFGEADIILVAKKE